MLTQASSRRNRRGAHPGGGKNRPLSTVELLAGSEEEEVVIDYPQVQRKFSLGNHQEAPIGGLFPRPENDLRRQQQQQMQNDQIERSSECFDDDCLYDFFDRNLRGAEVEGDRREKKLEEQQVAGVEEGAADIKAEDFVAPIAGGVSPVKDEPGCSQDSANVTPRHRPRSWYVDSPEEAKKARRRQTHPGHHADYQEALSSLLWQPYECQREVTGCSSPDDSDVAFWLGCRLPELRIPRDDDDDLSQQSSATPSPTSSASSGADALARLKEIAEKWGKEHSASSLRGLLEERVSDPESERLPPGALLRPSPCPRIGASVEPDASRDGATMRVDGDTGPGPPPVNVSLVRCYADRQQTATTVSTVPSIDCSNSSSSSNTVGCTSSNNNIPPVRTFTSTEAQTDDVVVDVVRPRDRRRHPRRPQPPPPAPAQAAAPAPLTDRLPDILNSHLPPPYSTLPVGLPPPPAPHLPPPVPVLPSPGSPPPTASNIVTGLRFPFAIVPAGRRRSPQYTSPQEPKSCCGVSVSQAVSIRWFILLIFLVGLCCAVVGTILGATKATGREHLTVSLLMIGVGVVLVTVSGVAWRLTSQDAPSCRAMLGLGGTDEIGASEPNRRFVPRLPPSYGRPHHPYAAMMYPEFQYRAPPPSYQASMQEYRLRLLLLDRHNSPTANSVSPPPTYRSQAGSLLRAPIGCNRRDVLHYQAPSQSEYSRPPSYRSRSSSTRPGNADPAQSIGTHSRDPSQLSISDAGGVCSSAVNVITVMGHDPSRDSEPIIKLAPDEPSLSTIGICSKDESKDANLVTIVQTSSESSGPVIVTISGNADDGSSSHCRDTEMEILAHL